MHPGENSMSSFILTSQTLPLSRLVQPLNFVLGLWPEPTVAESADELALLAEGYEATQPSYAADLRAAAETARRH
jgi:hypothetical protein